MNRVFHYHPCIGAALVTLAATVGQQAALAQQSVVEIKAPAGKYELDARHANLSFSVVHLGMSNYVARFTAYQATLDLVPSDLAASSVVVSIDPASIRTDYPADYKTSPNYPKFQGWDDELARSERFLNAGKFARMEFRSTKVEPGPGGELTIVGNLSLLGQTQPVTLKAKLVGSAATHPLSGKGGIVGFSATGVFNRSAFGMTQLLKPPIVSDAVTLRFEGEFGQVQPAAADKAKPANS